MHFARRSAWAIILMALAACKTASLQDVAPTAAVVEPKSEPPVPTPKPDEAETVDGPTNTGAFPNLNVRPDAAAGQLSEEEKAAEIARLNAARAGQGSSAGASPAEIARLKKLAVSHGDKALEEIEK
ncbi:MAG: hypothetical protein IPL47_07935 [Phyllobacteriaceae bacterium]|nr:hypothetical protein [Phyllobacteriaceae bacterium]